MQPSILLAFFAAAAYCSLLLSLMSTRTPRSLSTEMLHCQVDPSLSCTPVLCFPSCKTLHFSMLHFIRFLLAHSSSLSRSFCRVALSPTVSTSPRSLVSLANFIRVSLIPSSTSLMKILNNVGPNIDSCRTPLVTGCQFEKRALTTTLWV